MSLTINQNTAQIIISRGDDGTLRYTVRNSSGAVYDVSANSFAFTVKASIDDSITDAVFQKTNPAASGIDLTLAATGIVDVNIADTDTSGLAGAYQYDLQMIQSGKYYTLGQGLFLVRKDVTTPGTPSTPGGGAIFLIAGDFYMLDATTGLYSGFRLDNGAFQQSATQSATIPFSF